MKQYLIANAVLRAFIASGKRHLLLTGERGSGKSTLFSALLNELPGAFSGYRSHAIPKEAVILSGLREEKQRTVAYYDPSLPGTDKKMRLLQDMFLQSIGLFSDDTSPYLAIDELGYMEAELPAFQCFIRSEMEKKQLLMTIRKERLPFLQELRGRDDVFFVDLDCPFGRTGAVLMASGEGKRFGANKLLSEFRGAPLFTHMLGTVSAQLDTVVVTRYSEIRACCEENGISSILHSEESKAATIRLGTERFSSYDRILFCPADQPLLSSASLSALCLLGAVYPDSICRMSFEDIPGSPVLFPAVCFPELMTLRNGESGSAVIQRHQTMVKRLEAGSPEELRDIDTPDDIEELNKHYDQ